MTTAIRIDGAITTWSLCQQTKLATLNDGLARHGFDRFRAHPRTYAACLKDALSEVCGSRTTLIRPLKSGTDGTEGFMVIEETRDLNSNGYSARITAKVTPEPKIMLHPYDPDLAAKLVDAFNKQMGLVRPPSVTTALVGIVRCLTGTSIRPDGAVYWLPDYNLGQWELIRKVVRDAAYEGRNEVYLIRHHFDQDSIACIVDGLCNEVNNRVNDISEEVMDTENPLGKRALENRQLEAEMLGKKIKEYEELMNVKLDDLRNSVTNVDTAIVQAKMVGLTAEVA